MVILTQDFITTDNAGLKAYRLKLLAEEGFCVPAFVCLPAETVFPGEAPVLSEAELRHLQENYFPGVEYFTVRSSAAMLEESSAFPGPFELFIKVLPQGLSAAIASARHAMYSESGLRFCAEKRISPSELPMGVIIQEWREPQASGVLFSANPQGLLSETVIVAGAEVGEGVTNGRAPVTTYYCHRGDKVSYYITRAARPALGARSVNELLRAAEVMERRLGMPVDMEYALSGHEIIIRQVRPMHQLHTHHPAVLVSAHIRGDYPELTRPIHASLAEQGYRTAFAALESLGGVLPTETDKVYCVSGRMYYHQGRVEAVIRHSPLGAWLAEQWTRLTGLAVEAGELTPLSAAQRGLLQRERLRLMRRVRKEKPRYQALVENFEELFSTGLSADELKALYDGLEGDMTALWELMAVHTLLAAEAKAAAEQRGGNPLTALMNKRRTQAIESGQDWLEQERVRVRQMADRLFGAMGQRLAEAGRLESADEVWYLTLPELWEALAAGRGHEAHEQAQARRQAYRQYEQMPGLTRLVFAGAVEQKLLHRTGRIELLTAEVDDGQEVPAAGGGQFYETKAPA